MLFSLKANKLLDSEPEVSFQIKNHALGMRAPIKDCGNQPCWAVLNTII